MGRPLNKRLMGQPTAAGSEIKVNFHNGTAVKEGYIVKQKGSKKFVCEEIETAGEMSISFKMDDSETYGVSKISGKKATLSAPSATGSNVYDGLTVPWNFATSTSDGAAQVEEAGDDNTLSGTDDDDFTEDA